MIRKLLLFALLLTAGFAVLHYAVGLDFDDSAAVTEEQIKGGTDDRGSPDGNAPPADTGSPGISFQGKGDDDIVTTEIRGRIESWLGERVVALPGRTLRLPRATLVAEDSRPLPDGRQLLERVTIEFFDADIGPDRAENTLVGTLNAETAYAELVADPRRGERSIRSDKEVEMLGVRFATTSPDLDGSTLTIARLFAVVLEDRVRIDSQEREPFVLEIESDPPARLEGQGLRAHVPIGKDPVGRAELLVRHDPVLTYGTGPGALRLEGTGNLRYFEVVGSGTAGVSLEDDVVATIPGSSLLGGSRLGGGEGRGTTVARGSRLTAQIARGRGLTEGASRQGTAALRSLRLWGEPAVVEGPEGSLVCQEVVGVPALDGRPYAISALGSNTRMTTRNQTEDGRTVTTTFEAARHAHVIRPMAHLGPLLAAYGVPRWAAGTALGRDLVVFEGETTIDNHLGELPAGVAAASTGRSARLPTDLRIVSGEGLVASLDVASDRLLAVGKGPAEVVQPEDGPHPRTVLRGNDGFALRVDGETLDLQLGPEDDPSHRFGFDRGALSVGGSGSCRLERDAAGHSVLTLRSHERDLTATFEIEGTAGGRGTPATVSELGYLQVHFEGNDWTYLQASGERSTAVWEGMEGRVEARFRLMSSIGRTGVLFEGTEADPARVDWRGDLRALGGSRARRGELALRGAQIELFRAESGLDAPPRPGAKPDPVLLSLDALSPTGGETRLVLDLPADGTAPAEHIDLAALHVRVMPFALSPEIRRAHTSVLGEALGRVVMAQAASPWLLADDAVRFDREIADSLQAHAEGERLVVGLETQVGYLDGMPAIAEWIGEDGVRHRGEARRVRFAQDRDAPSAVLVEVDDVRPVLTMHDAGAGGQPSYRATVDGDVHVEGAEAWCAGPAVLEPLGTDGMVDPDGITVRADDVRVRRNRETGEPMSVTAKGNGSFESRRLSGRASLVEIDLLRHTARASEPGGTASVRMNGNTFTARTVQANYETMAVRCWGSTMTWRGDEPGASPAQRDETRERGDR